MKAWMRVLIVIFKSSKQKKQLTFGINYLLENQTEDLSINITGNKYMSALKDSCTIQIDNLTYKELVELIRGEYDSVEVKSGYRTSGVQTIFKGGILYISQSLGDKKTTTATILCASELVAKYNKNRLNLTLNSGINMYSALNFICKVAGIPNSNISTQLKKEFIQDIVNVNGGVGNYIENLMNNNSTYVINSDGTDNTNLMLYDASKSNNRIIELNSNNILLSGGFPTLNKDGLNISLLPTFGFMCGDVIKIDNSIIDISTTFFSTDEYSKGYYLDKEGMYIIYEISYKLQNRGTNFSLNLKCKPRSLMSNILGG